MPSTPKQKPVFEYDWTHFTSNPFGRSIAIRKVGERFITGTSPVLSYDETTGIIETEAAVYVPAGSLTE